MTTIHIPAEWSKHKAIYTAWPSHADLWLEDLEPARGEVAAMILALAKGDSMRVLAHGADAVKSAKKMLGSAAEVIAVPFGDIWLRDTGPIFAHTGNGKLALRFLTNGWGGKYALEHDDTVGDAIALHSGVPMQAHAFILEGGAVEHNGSGIVLTTRQCLLNPNRNSGWTEAEAERQLERALGCSRVIWLDEGMMNDHTDGHIDNLARFIGGDTVVCQHVTERSDPNAELYREIAAKLLMAGLQVCTIPSPGRVTNEDGDPVAASHMNFIIGNDTVVVPVYGTATADEAVQSLQRLFPDRRVIGLTSNALLSGGGSFHCITKQEPS
jgi:agmatine deiminase